MRFRERFGPPWTPLQRRLTEAALLSCAAAGAIWLGLTHFYVGPSDADDFLYCDLAASGKLYWPTRNRYVHIWALRLFYGLADSQRMAAALYAAVCIAAIACLSYACGRRLAGLAGGVLALLVVPFFPPLLKYFSVPHVDLTLTVWSLAALLCTLQAVEGKAAPPGRVWATLSGIACLFALESKETALVLPPLILYLFWQGKVSWRTQAYWLAGLSLGWLLLLLLDSAFAAAGSSFSADLRQYFGENPAGPARSRRPPKVRMVREYFGQLTGPSFRVFALMGLLGAAHGFRRDPTVKALTLWLLGLLTFTALISTRSQGIDANDRYVISMGVALTLLAVYWLVSVWSREEGSERENLIWLLPLLLVVGIPALRGLFQVHFADGDADVRAVRSEFFLVPLLVIILLLTPWLTSGRWLPRLSLGTALSIAMALSFSEGHHQHLKRQRDLKPWLHMVEALDRGEAGLAIVRSDAVQAMRQLQGHRIRRRVEVLSQRKRSSYRVRWVGDPKHLRPDEWIFVGQKDALSYRAQGYQVIVKSRRGPKWTVLRPPG
ncbi:MAG: glycosyltransferase family 39 protein [Myxococcales bacterium]|nr:glycosyltransferase family 39 protein [Myxococcales bacterium]